MNTTENNKLIAEFMGCENPQAWEDELYITDWNWLMSVVDKIENIKIKRGYTFFVEISKNKVHIKYFYKGEEFSNLFCYYHEGRSKIETIYEAVVEFIKWYNEQ